jgi:hypothetical protein
MATKVKGGKEMLMNFSTGTNAQYQNLDKKKYISGLNHVIKNRPKDVTMLEIFEILAKSKIDKNEQLSDLEKELFKFITSGMKAIIETSIKY